MKGIIRLMFMLIVMGAVLAAANSRVVAQSAFKCPEPTAQVDRNIKADLDGKAETIFKIGDIGLKGRVETTIVNLFAAYPNADRVAVAQTFLSVECSLLSNSNIPDSEKADRWRDLFELWLKYSSHGENSFMARQVAYASRRAKESAAAAREQAQRYPASEVEYALRKANEAEQKMSAMFGGGNPTQIDQDGSYYWGELNNNQRNGLGSSCCDEHYVGQWKDGHKSGFGRIFVYGGMEYVGTFANNIIDGHGCVVFPVSEIVCGVFDGREFKGVIVNQIFKSGIAGQRQIGVWNESGMFEGVIVVFFLTDTDHDVAGSRYEGDVHESARNGYGVGYFPDGTRYEGQWVRRSITGFGRKIGPDGRVIVAGYWQDGKIIGSVDPALAEGN